MSASAAPSTTSVDSTDLRPESLILFPNGLVGQPEWKHFVLHTPDEDGLVRLLQSSEDAGVGLMVTDPRQLVADYSIALSSDDLRALDLTAGDDPTVLCTISIHGDEITTNLVGPLVINARAGLGKQMVLADSPYSTRFPVGPLPTKEQ